MSSATAQESKPINILALGDSYTIGQGVDVDKRWTNQLVELLASKNIQAQIKIIAQTGWTTTELEYAITQSTLDAPYDLVTLLIGVNDQFRGGDIDAYKRNFKRLLQTSIDYTTGKTRQVIVLSIPDYAVTPFARRFNPQKISTEIDSYNDVNRMISQQLGVNYIDITAISRLAKDDNSLLAEDGLHPSGRMYQQWAEKVNLFVIEIFKKNKLMLNN